MTWTPGFVAQRFREAAGAVRGLPDDRPKKPRTATPSPARDRKDAWLQAGGEGDPWGLYRHDPPVVSHETDRKALAALDQVQGWRPYVSLDGWRICWAWALSVKDKRVMRKLKIARVTLWRKRRAAMVRICAELNRGGVVCPYLAVPELLFEEMEKRRMR